MVHELFYPAAHLPWQFVALLRVPPVEVVLRIAVSVWRLSFHAKCLDVAELFAVSWASAVAEVWAPFAWGSLPWQ